MGTNLHLPVWLVAGITSIIFLLKYWPRIYILESQRQQSLDAAALLCWLDFASPSRGALGHFEFPVSFSGRLYIIYSFMIDLNYIALHRNCTLS
ncbi:hypothetical protein ACU8KH_04338 [Lachancea thermotolerans]